jgi:hypothetical protein
MREENFNAENRENLGSPMVQRIIGVDEGTLRQLAEIEKLCFSEEMAEDQEELTEVLESPGSIHLKLEDNEGKILGYISSVRQGSEFDSLKEWDPDLEKDDSLYIHSFDIRPEARNLKNFNALFGRLKQEALLQGYKKLSMYARTENKLSEVLQKRYGAKFFRRIKNWRDLGEDLDYLEVDLEENNLEK